jgi:DNA modification methylase
MNDLILPGARVLVGDCIARMKDLPDQSVQMCVTSPPYFGLRDYGHEGQLGLEETPEQYIAAMVAVFREVRRVLADDGTLWVNIGDSYAGSWGNQGRKEERGTQRQINGEMMQQVNDGRYPTTGTKTGSLDRTPGCKNKDLIGIPWMLAFALRADGWYLRQDIIWHKPNPMPESIRDRCTKAHEYVFLLSKSHRYFYDNDAVKEPVAGDPDAPRNRWDTKTYEVPGQKPQKRVSRSGNLERKPGSARGCPEGTGQNVNGSVPWEGSTRNRRSVWTIATRPYKGAHFAVFPPALVEPCILAGSRPGDTVLDPFNGSGTTGAVAIQHGRQYVGTELNPDYIPLTCERLEGAIKVREDEERAAAEKAAEPLQLSLIDEAA